MWMRLALKDTISGTFSDPLEKVFAISRGFSFSVYFFGDGSGGGREACYLIT